MSKANSTKTNSGASTLYLPAGFRFHPTDEELVVHYLAKKAECKPFPVPVIAEVDLYKFNPWELPQKAYFGEKEWYFFTPRDRKYPNGARPNRAAASGYWKATGTDKPILSRGNKKVGVKKALVFYDGKAPKGKKTNWIMHEYRLANSTNSSSNKLEKPSKNKSSLRLDDWVLCRIYEKTSSAFKVMVSNIEREAAEPLEFDNKEPSGAEGEAELEAEVEAEEVESGLDEMLASLPDIGKIPLPQLGNNVNSPRHPFDDLVQRTDSLSGRSGVLQAAQPATEYPPKFSVFEDSTVQESSNLFGDMDNKSGLNYWALYPNSNFLSIDSPLLRLTPSCYHWAPPSRKRVRSLDEEDVLSTCRSPLPCSKQRHIFPTMV